MNRPFFCMRCKQIISDKWAMLCVCEYAVCNNCAKSYDDRSDFKCVNCVEDYKEYMKKGEVLKREYDELIKQRIEQQIHFEKLFLKYKQKETTVKCGTCKTDIIVEKTNFNNVFHCQNCMNIYNSIKNHSTITHHSNPNDRWFTQDRHF